MDDFPQILKLFAAMGLVLALMGGLTLALKRLGLSGALPLSQEPKRLKLIEALPLDGSRKLVIIARDDKEHLVILGANGETVVETDIKRSKKGSVNKKKAK